MILKIYKALACVAFAIATPVICSAEVMSQVNNGKNGTNISNSGHGQQTNIIFGNLASNSSAVDNNQIVMLLAALKKEANRRNEKRDPLFTKLERFLVSSNPTEIEVQYYTFEKWLGDDEEALTIHVYNASNLPAESVSFRILLPQKSGEKESAAVTFKGSAAIPARLRKAIYMPQQQKIGLPFALLSELRAAVESGRTKDFEMIGAGLSHELPIDVKEKFEERSRVSTPGSFQYFSYTNELLGIEINFTTIFNQKITRIFPINIYFGKNMNAPLQQNVQEEDKKTPS